MRSPAAPSLLAHVLSERFCDGGRSVTRNTASPGSACAWTAAPCAAGLGAQGHRGRGDEGRGGAHCFLHLHRCDPGGGRPRVRRRLALGDRCHGVSRSGIVVRVDNPLQLGEGLRRCGPARPPQPGSRGDVEPASAQTTRVFAVGRSSAHRWSGRHLPASDRHTQRGAAPEAADRLRTKGELPNLSLGCQWWARRCRVGFRPWRDRAGSSHAAAGCLAGERTDHWIACSE